VRPRLAAGWIALGGIAMFVLVVALIAALRLAQPLAPAPVSNPGAGVDAPRLTPPPRYDWTDDQ
jgi:hypothetical protein